MPPPGNTPWAGRRPGRHAFPTPVARYIRQRDGRCMLGLPGCTGEPDIADHRLGWADATALGWTPAQVDDPDLNGQAACHTCHHTKTQTEAARGRARTRSQRSRLRPTERHPGLL